MERTSESGLPVDPVYDDIKLTDSGPERDLGGPAQYPSTRGVYPWMHPAKAAEGPDNVFYPLRAHAALGAADDTLRDVWGESQPETI